MRREQLGILGSASMVAFLPTYHGSHSQDLTTTRSPSTQSISQLEQAVRNTRSQLNQLPLRLISESGGTLGFQAYQRHSKPGRSWVEIDLGANRQFDRIVLIPTVFLNEKRIASNYAFPTKFRLHTYSSEGDETGELLFDTSEHPLDPPPKKSPVIIDCPGASAHRIRITPQQLFRTPNNPYYCFSLSELLVFDGNENLALGKPVKTTKWTHHTPMWHKDYLTDGYTPYSEPSIGIAPQTNGSRMFVPPNHKTPASITIDLGRIQPLHEIRLYPLQMEQNFVLFHQMALGFPQRFKIEISKDERFTSPTIVFQNSRRDYPSPGLRVACFSAHKTSGRFVRITASHLPAHPRKRGTVFAMSEIEVLSAGLPVSRNAQVTFSHPVDIERLPPSMLVDGQTANGDILPWRSWLENLSERNRLELQLAQLESALQQHYLRQSQIVRTLQWGVGFVALLGVGVFLWQRTLRERSLFRLREDLAGDLHDEIGGNFSGIALLSDNLAHDPETPPSHVPQLETIAKISRTSANDTRALVRFLESKNASGELLAQMQSIGKLLLADHRYRFETEGDRYANQLDPKQKWHLLLFFKEALNNIVKHAHATHVDISLELSPHRLKLVISDDGRGLALPHAKRPAHLDMRAKRLNATLQTSSPPESGTTVTLTMLL